MGFSGALGRAPPLARARGGAPPGSRRVLPASVPAEAPGELDVEGVEVELADPLEELGRPGVGQGFGQLVAPSLVLGL